MRKLRSKRTSERVQNQIKDNPANPYRMSSDKGLYDHFNIIFDFFMSSSLASVGTRCVIGFAMSFTCAETCSYARRRFSRGKIGIIWEAMRAVGGLATLQRLTPSLHTPRAEININYAVMFTFTWFLCFYKPFHFSLTKIECVAKNKPFMDFSALLPFTNWLLLWEFFSLIPFICEQKLPKQICKTTVFWANECQTSNVLFSGLKKGKKCQDRVKDFFSLNFSVNSLGYNVNVTLRQRGEFLTEEIPRNEKLLKALFCVEFIKVGD